MTVGRLAGLGAVIAGTLAQQADYYLKFWPGLGELPIDPMAAEGLALQELQHGGRQCLGHAVDLVDKQNPLLQSRGLNLVVDGGHDRS